MIIKIENNLPVGNPILEENFKALYPETSFPLILNNDIVNPFGYAMYDFSQIPERTELQTVVEIAPVLNAFGIWRQQWQVNDLTGQALEDKQTELENLRVHRLWAAATLVETSAISGSAIGLITIGIIQNKPKCVAMQLWLKTLWDEYYVRKANGSTDYDFTVFSSAPHSVPEIMTELM